MNLIDAAKQALDALTDFDYDKRLTAIDALEKAIEEAEKAEPVAWMHKQGNFKEPSTRQLSDEEIERRWEQYPLYTAPPQREWVGLSDDEIDEGQKHSWVVKQAFESAVWWAEEKLKEKNT